MAYYCLRSNKKSSIFQEISACDGRCYQSLIIHTCYLDKDLSAAKEFIAYVRSRVQYLEKVIIYADEKEVQKRYCDIKYFLNHFRGIDVEFNVVDCDRLFHSKAYALIAFDDDVIVSGGLVVGSGNLTGNGVTSQSGNIESFLASNDIDDIQEFWDRTQNLNCISFSEWTPKEENLNEFIVNSGVFLHLWTDNDYSNQKLLLKYDLTEDYKQKIKEDQSTLNKLNFDINANTISKRYFILPDSDVSTEGWKRNYLIETYLGYWIPKTVLKQLTNKTDDEGLNSFKEKVCQSLNEQYENVKSTIESDYNTLVQENIIKRIVDNSGKERNPAVDILEKINAFCENENAIARLYYKYDEFDFPYDEHSDEYEEKIEEMIDCMNDTVGSYKNSRKVFVAYRDAMNGNKKAFDEMEL